MTIISQDQVQIAKNKLEEKLREYGSVELMANLAIKEIYDQSFLFHNPANPMGENPFVAYSLGLFLSNNNIGAKEPHPNQLNEFVELLSQYFNAFRLSLMYMDETTHTIKDSITFLSQQQKILDDGNHHIYPNQKDDYYQQVFSPLGNYFVAKFGFSVQDAIHFVSTFSVQLHKHMENRYKFAVEKYHEAEEQLKKPEMAPLLKQHNKKNITPEHICGFYADAIRLGGSKNILTINVDGYCKQQNITNVEVFRKYLNAFSCVLGEQFESFESPLTDNILFYKPIIKLDNNTFFLPKPDFLDDKLDRLLEFLLKEEKQFQSNIWNKFVKLKSGYLENKSFEFFSRVFPKKCLVRNAYYWIGHDRMEIDLLAIYDNKIFIIESKSGNLPLSAKQEGQEQLQIRLTDLVKKALQQAASARDYIKSQPKVKLWNRAKDQVLLEIDSSQTNYEFFFIDVTLEYLGAFATDPKSIEVFDFFKENEYPWLIYLHDLDVVTDLLREPIYFIHYIEQRLIAQKQHVLSSSFELSLLGYYLKNGTLQPHLLDDLKNTPKIMLTVDFVDSIEEYYLNRKRKPQLTIPKKLEELLLNMQKYHQRGFTKITSLLLDFPSPDQQFIAESLDKKLNNTIKTGEDDGFLFALDSPFKMGFSYFTSTTMSGFYKSCKICFQKRKDQLKTTRHAMIGRNVRDKKNFATFFLYDDTS